MHKILNTGLIGFGMAGRVFHAPFLDALPGFRLSKISTTKPAAIQEIQSRYPEAEIVPKADDILADPAIDLVVIGTPNDIHAALAMEALKAGKHVIVEKPFTVTSAEADFLINLAHEHNKVLTVHQNRRWDGDFKTVQKVITSGQLGELLSYEAHYDRYRPQLKENAWREAAGPGTGILYDLGSHLVDQALLLFGLPDAVQADVRTQRPGAQATDFFDVTLLYGSRLRARLGAGMLVKEPGPHFVLQGMEGSFTKYGMDVQEAALKAGRSPNAPNWGQEPADLHGHLATHRQGLEFSGTVATEPGSYADFFTNVYDTIHGHAPLAVEPIQARNVIRTLELAQQSSNQQRPIQWSDR